MRRTVAILVFDEVEVLGFAGPFEAFASAGISAGIDCFLHLVGRLLGAGAAGKTADYKEYAKGIGC